MKPPAVQPATLQQQLLHPLRRRGQKRHFRLTHPRVTELTETILKLHATGGQARQIDTLRSG
ncbi:MAG: hypothetical protein CM15mP77_0300 [Synechococcus sp.]|nr:MAG: hypothetical protein CM15mP77_0300 [Synechococcus sp.]